MSHSHNNFNSSDSQNIANTFDASDGHLTNARLEITNSLNTDPVDSMRPNTSKDFLPSAKFAANSDSIVFGSSNPGASNDDHTHNNGSYLEVGNQNAGDDPNHESTARSGLMADNKTLNDGVDHNGNDVLPSTTHAASDGHDHGPSGTDAFDGHKHPGRLGSDLLAGNHTISDGQNHQGALSTHTNLTDGDSARFVHQSEMSQQAARLGLGARDIAFIQQLESSVPHTSSRELAERLKAARSWGGILDLSKTPTDNA